MKKTFAVVCLGVTLLFMQQSCDYVSNAIPQASTSTGTSTGTTGSNVVYRKVLIEDYTGHKCGNCPGAARELRKLDSIYAGKIVPIAVHAGFYAVVNGTYPTDLRSQAGTDWDAAFVISAGPGNPNGLVNRVGYGGSNFIQTYSNWGTSATGMDTMKAAFKIDIANAYNTGSGVLSTTVTSTALKSLSGTYNLSVVITEDSIIGPQLDYSLNTSQYPSQIYPNYVFNHVLRGAVNTSWGEQIFNGTVNVSDIQTKTYNFTIPSTWAYKHCKVVAFVYDAGTSSATHFEVLQAEDKAVQ